nr:hypothetical protein 1 [Gammaproteobacteria bacterium]BDD48027.1 hypothetical protein 6 [Gammaproteobacteria bacterium]
MTKLENKTKPQLIRTLDKVFSKYIRLRDSNDEGWLSCITCGVLRHWKKADAGHFQLRARRATRWDERNVNGQCKRCNGDKKGRQYDHGVAIDKKYGEGTAFELYELAKKTKNWKLYELRKMIIEYKEKIKSYE